MPLIALILTLIAMPLAAQEYSAAETALRTGKYEQAIAAFTKLASAEPAPPAALDGLVRSLMIVGRYDEAEAAARRSPELANRLGEVLYGRGMLDQAAESFRKAIARNKADRLSAELNLAIVDYDQGRRAAAMKAFDRFIDVYNSGAKLSAQDLTAIGTACRYLSEEHPQMAKDALKAFDEAIAADPNDLEPRLRLGDLFLERYNSTDAEETFQGILKINSTNPRAVLGMARAKNFDGDPQSDTIEAPDDGTPSWFFLKHARHVRSMRAGALGSLA